MGQQQQQQQQMQQALPLGALQALAEVAAASLLLSQSSPTLGQQLDQHLASAPLLVQQRQVHQAHLTQ
jgi:hypothetical protein